MSFVVENLRLKELAVVAEQNHPCFDYFVRFLGDFGYGSLFAFITDTDEQRALAALSAYLKEPWPEGIALYDGIARPYIESKAKWLLLGWILRDAPEQRLRPMLSSMPGTSTIEKQAYLFNEIRKHVATIFTREAQWNWTAIAEVVVDRLEGSRRAIKGTLFEVIVRRNLAEIFSSTATVLKICPTEIRLDGETYDVEVTGTRGRMLLPVKTRETMGGGHAGLFTRDIHKSISVAQSNGYDCLPIIIAESWVADLTGLACSGHVYINMNPNQIVDVEPVLATALRAHLPVFQSIV